MNIASSLQRLLAVLLLAAVSACATVPAPGQKASPAAAIDPWENWNRKVFAFNEGVDEAMFISQLPMQRHWPAPSRRLTLCQ